MSTILYYYAHYLEWVDRFVLRCRWPWFCDVVMTLTWWTHQEWLNAMAQRARADYDAGLTEPLDLDRL